MKNSTTEPFNTANSKNATMLGAVQFKSEIKS